MVGRPRGVLSRVAAHLAAPSSAAAAGPAERFRGGGLASLSATDLPLEFVDNGFRLGHADASRLPQANADGEPVIPLTAEQRYAFDTQGWVVLPGVLDEQEAAACRAYCHQQIAARGSPDEGSPEWGALDSGLVSGPLQRLSDHPALVGFMNEFVAHTELSSQSCYGFRMESAHLTIRAPGWSPSKERSKLAPHNGAGLLRLPGDSHQYAQLPGRANSSLTCAIWELAPVSAPGGGSEALAPPANKPAGRLTECGACCAALFLNGSHKAAFNPPPSIAKIDSPLWSRYSCPAGSLVLFAESCCHSHSPNDGGERVAIFSRYNAVNAKWHRWEPSEASLASMPPMRRTLFRPVHWEANLVDGF